MNRIRELRKKMRYSQNELAQECNVTQGTVSNWEIGRNEIGKEDAKTLAKLFGVSAQYLMCLTDDPTPTAKAEPEPQEIPAQEQDEIWELREELRRNPDLRMLFSATKNATADDLRRTVAILNALKGNDDQ